MFSDCASTSSYLIRVHPDVACLKADGGESVSDDLVVCVAHVY